MNESNELPQTRRAFLGLAAGLLTAGCAANGGGTQRMLLGGRGRGFPYPEEWCWKAATTKNLDTLGRVIMQERNPYCQLGYNAVSCDATNPATWPHELTDEATWKILTEFDFQADPNDANQKWGEFKAGVIPKVIRSMRIPYLIGQGRVKRKKTLSDVGNLARENLLVGYEYVGGVPGATEAWDLDTNCKDDSVGELARFITDNMMRETDTESLCVTGWAADPGNTNARWFFRRAPIVVDYSFRLQIASRRNAGTAELGWLYVGYEGGGAY